MQLARALAAAILTAAVVTATAVAGTTACGICGKNLIKNPGAEAGAGITAVGAFGAVPGWTNEAGQFGAASYTFPNGWFSEELEGLAEARQELLLRGDDDGRPSSAKATIGKQTIKLPAAAAGRKATLSGWLGNYGNGPTANMRRCGRSSPTRPAGARAAQDRQGHDDLGHRHGRPEPQAAQFRAGAKQVTIVVTFGGTTAAYKLAGADDLSLVLA